MDIDRIKGLLDDLERRCKSEKVLATKLGLQKVVTKLDDDLQLAQAEVARKILDAARAAAAVNPPEAKMLAEKAKEIVAGAPTGQQAKRDVLDEIDAFLRGAPASAPATPRTTTPGAAPPPPTGTAGGASPTPPGPAPPGSTPGRKVDVERLVEEKIAEANKLASDGKYDDAKALLGGETMSAAAGHPELMERIKTMVAEIDEKKRFADLNKELAAFLNDKKNIFFSLTTIRDVLKSILEGMDASEPANLDKLSANLKSKINDAEQKIAGFMDTAKKSVDKKEDVKKKLAYKLDQTIKEFNELWKIDSKKGIDLRPHAVFMKILRHFEEFVDEL